MAYEGDPLNVCMAQAFDFSNTSAVVVSGDFPNPCGHMVLNVGGDAGYYFHIAGLYKQPRHMTLPGFRRYLRENEKRVLSRTPVHIPNPRAAQAKLDELLSRRWAWWAVPNNCAAFVEDVIRAGGAQHWLWSNCPSRERFTR